MRHVTWDDFSKGEYGGEDPRKWPKGAWSGVNVLPYVDGSIGRRPGFRRVDRHTRTVPADVDFARAGIAAAPGHGRVFVGALADSTTNPLAAASLIRSLDPVSGFSTTVMTEAGGLNEAGSLRPGRGYLLLRRSGASVLYVSAPQASPAAVVHRFSTAVFLGTTLTGSVALDAGGLSTSLAVQGARMIMSRPDDNSVVAFSRADDFDTDWDPLDVISVDDRGPGGLAVQRGHVAVAKRDGSWVLITGVLGGAQTVRTLASSSEAEDQLLAPALGGDELLWGFSTRLRSPTSFDGSVASVLRRVRVPDALEFDDRQELQGGSAILFAGSHAVGTTDGVVVMVFITPESGGDQLLFNRHGTWSRHDLASLDVLSTRMDVASLPVNRLLLGRVIVDDPIDRLHLDVLMARTDLERPPFVNGATGALQHEDINDDATEPAAEFTSPQHWDPDAQAVLRGVTVDFTSYNTGSASPNEFAVALTVHGLRDAAGSRTEVAQSWTEAPSASSTSGTRQSRTFWFGEASPGRAFDANLSVLRGVAVRSVTAHYEPAGRAV